MEQSTGTLSATILDRRSSSPLAGARVSCVWRDQRITTLRLDQHGKLRVELPEGVYDLIISANGFLSLLLRGIGILGGNDLQLMRALVPGAGQESDGDPATAVGGYVLDRLKRPLRNILVHASGEGHSYTARTDRSGAFIMHGVAPECTISNSPVSRKSSNASRSRSRTFAASSASTRRYYSSNRYRN